MHVGPGVLPGLGSSAPLLQKGLSFQTSSPCGVTEMATSSHGNSQKESSRPVVQAEGLGISLLLTLGLLQRGKGRPPARVPE